jgi:putative PIN family toxin of toxin-antitoxin system
VRIVIDTNVLISATFWTGNPKQLLNRVRKEEFVILTSQILLNELKEILIRPDKPFKLSEEEAEHVVNRIRSLAEIVRTHSFVKICRDEQDNRVLECAIDGGADWIISGDAHLLELQSFQGVRIGTVGDFLS